MEKVRTKKQKLLVVKREAISSPEPNCSVWFTPQRVCRVFFHFFYFFHFISVPFLRAFSFFFFSLYLIHGHERCLSSSLTKHGEYQIRNGSLLCRGVTWRRRRLSPMRQKGQEESRGDQPMKSNLVQPSEWASGKWLLHETSISLQQRVKFHCQCI